MPRVYTTTRMLRFGDCDVSGTAYYPSYMNILNGVNEEFWGHIGFPWHDVIRNKRWATPTVHLSSDFTSPSFFGDELQFDLTVLKVGRSSMTIHNEISCKGERRWSCTQVLVASDLDKHASIPWPDEVRAELLTWMGPDA